MSSRFPPSNTGEPRYSRDRTPPRSLDRRPSFNDAPRHNDQGYRANDSYGNRGRSREPPREPPRAPKALIDGPRGGGFPPRGRGSFPARGERDFRDARDEPFPRRGRGQDWGPRDRFDRRPSPIGRERSRSPLSRDFRDARDARDYAPREDLRRDSRDSLPPVSSDTLARGRGGFRGRGRGRGDWDLSRDRNSYAEEREGFRARSRSHDRGWEKPIRDDRDRDRDFDLLRRDDDSRRDRDDREREDRLRKELPPYRPDSRNSTGGAPTPLTSRSTSTTSVHLANLDRYAHNTRESRDTLQESRLKNDDNKPGGVEKEQERGEAPPRRRENEVNEVRPPSTPPQAPPVPAFGSIPNRAPAANQELYTKPHSPTERSPLLHSSRPNIAEPSKSVPSAPKAHSLSNAPTAPKAQQAPERWSNDKVLDPARRLPETDGTRFGPSRSFAGPLDLSTRGPPFDHVRNISKRFSHGDSDAPSSTADSTQPSVKKAVEEQGRNGSASSAKPPVSTLRTPLIDTSSHGSPVKIPTGPRAERTAPLAVRQPVPPIARGPPIRGPSMIPRGGRGSAWSWVNPDLPKHTPRGPSQPSIMNVVPSKRDAIGEDKSKASIPSSESTAAAVAKWHRKNTPAGITAGQHATRDHGPSQPSPGIMHRVPTTREAIKEEDNEDDKLEDGTINAEEDNEDIDSDELAAEDNQMDLDEEDFVKAEKTFDRDMQALKTKMPPSPQSNPRLLALLEELDALSSALEEKKTNTANESSPTAPVSMGLPSPKVDDAEEFEYKRESSIPPLPVKVRPQTPPVESLPFLNNGPPTPFSEIEDLQEDHDRQSAVETLLAEEFIKQRERLIVEDEKTRDTFARVYRQWRMSVEDFEEARRTEESFVDSSGVEDVPLVTPTASVVGRRGRVISELAMDEVLRISQETAAKEERVRREREAPVFLPPETFNPEREAVVPDMLDRYQAQSSKYTDTNYLIDPEDALHAFRFGHERDNFTESEHETFLTHYIIYPKRFGMIAASLENRDFRDCVQHYYLTKRSIKYKDRWAAFSKTKRGKKLATQMSTQIRPRASGLMSNFDGMVEYETQNVALTEKGRPRRAAAPTFGDVVEAETAASAPTPARRGPVANKDTSNSTAGSEKPTARRTRAPNKEKPGRKPKAQLLAAAPGPSPRKSLPDSSRAMSKEPLIESGPRIDELDGAQVLAGLSSGQSYVQQVYPQVPTEAWQHLNHPPPIVPEPIPHHVPQVIQDQPHPPQPKAPGASQTSSYWSVPEQQDFYNLVKHFGTNWQSIASTMKTKTHIMVRRDVFLRAISADDF